MSQPIKEIEGELLSSSVQKSTVKTVVRKPKSTHILSKEHYAKSHTLIFSSSKLSPMMQNIMALLFTRMTVDDWVDGDSGIECSPTYEFPADTVAKFFNLKRKHLSATLRTPCKNLVETSIGIATDNDEWEYKGLLAGAAFSKGVLKITPNPLLREDYIFKVAEKGQANIDLPIFLELKSAKSKVLFEILSRFQYGTSLYPIKLSKLKHYFGVLGENGKVLQKSYRTNVQFMNQVLEKACLDLHSNDMACEKLQLLQGVDHFGFELHESDDPNDPKVKFLYKWLEPTYISEDDKQNALKTISGLLQKKHQLESKGQKLPIEDFESLKYFAEVLGMKQQADVFAELIEKRKEEERLLQEKEQAKSDDLYKERATELFAAFLDDAHSSK